MKISVVWVTRKRSHELVYSLSSFIQNADDNKNIEYFFALDPDDKETEDALTKISPMCYANDAQLFCFVMDKRYGYGELEQYQNKAGELFTGECLFIFNDDLICIGRGWDTALRNTISPFKEEPFWIAAVPLNEIWKGTPTFIGINRKWYEIVGRVSGNRATDGYLKLVGQATGIFPLNTNMKLLHLQRGKGEMDYYDDGGAKKLIFGLPDDGAGGYSTKTKIDQKYTFTDGIGKQRLDEDIAKLKKWKNEHGK